MAEKIYNRYKLIRKPASGTAFTSKSIVRSSVDIGRHVTKALSGVALNLATKIIHGTACMGSQRSRIGQKTQQAISRSGIAVAIVKRFDEKSTEQLVNGTKVYDKKPSNSNLSTRKMTKTKILPPRSVALYRLKQQKKIRSGPNLYQNLTKKTVYE